MKKRCIYCYKEYESEQGDICPFCHKDNSFKQDEKQIHLLHQTCHTNIRLSNNMKNNALTNLVIGGILLIIGLVFLVLSFRYNVVKQRVFTPGSTEFVVCVICLVSSLTLISLGIYRLIVSLQKIKFYQGVIKENEVK